MPAVSPAGCIRTIRRCNKGWQSRQLHPGTRIVHYRCCLPALAGFANYRRGRTSGTTIDLLEAHDIRYILYVDHRLFADSCIGGKTGGEGGIRTREAGISRLHTFQACSFNRSDTSPHLENAWFPRGRENTVRTRAAQE